jgi:Tol biopolymer transport system component
VSLLVRLSLLALLALFVSAGTGAAATSSPQSQWIVFAGLRPAGANTWQAPQLFRIRTSGTGMRQLTVGMLGAIEPAFAPDGKGIVFVREGSGLFVVDVDGRGLRRLTRGNQDEHPTWSPDGSRIAFVRSYQHTAMKQQSAEQRVFVINAGGGTARPLLRTPTDVGQPTWTPDGKSLIIAAGGPPAGIYEVDARDGRVQRELYIRFDGDADSASLALSPDGRTLAYLDYRPAPPDCQSLACEVVAIYLARVPNGTRHRLPSIGDYISDAPPTWSPDGRQIAFAVDPSRLNGASLALEPIAGGAVKLLATGSTLVTGTIAWRSR